MTRLILATGLAAALMGIGAPAAGLAARAASTASPPPPSLNGELFNNRTYDNNSDVHCSSFTNGQFGYVVSGIAQGPYAGPYIETGRATITNGTVTAFTASFTITSPLGTVTGSKTFDITAPSTPAGYTGLCITGNQGSVAGVPTKYQATIQTGTGRYADAGTSLVNQASGYTSPDEQPGAFLSESYTSTQPSAMLMVPTSKDQCKDDGYRNYPQFRNQGECVSYVEHHR